jgi:type I restriction enzyme, S subunit
MAVSFPVDRLGRYAAIQGGFAFKSGDFMDSGVGVLKIKNIRLRDVDISDLEYVDIRVAKKATEYFCRFGDVLISMTGSGPQAPNSIVGRVARFAGPSGTYLINQRVGRILVKDTSRLDGRFLFYVLTQPEYQWHLVSIATGSANQVNISGGQIEDLEIPLPPLSEQRAIVHILGTLDDKIELNRRMNETLEAMARALFKSWFVDFDPVRAKMDGSWRKSESLPGLPAHLYDLFPDRLVDSDLGEIPEGWGVGMLGDVAEHPRRGVQPGQIEPETPYIALEHMAKDCIALSDWGVAKGLESNKFQFKTAEILFGKLRPYFHKVGVAPVDGVCSTDIVVITPKSSDWFGFVLGYVSSVAFVEYTNAGSTGTKMPRTSWNEMARYDIVIPPELLTEAFTNQIRPSVDHIISSIHESRTLARLRDTLLPKLISGMTRVKHARTFAETEP